MPHGNGLLRNCPAFRSAVPWLQLLPRFRRIRGTVEKPGVVMAWVVRVFLIAGLGLAVGGCSATAPTLSGPAAGPGAVLAPASNGQMASLPMGADRGDTRRPPPNPLATRVFASLAIERATGQAPAQPF